MKFPWNRRKSTAQPGDGRPLRNFGVLHSLWRTLFFIELPEGDERHEYAVDVHYFADELGSETWSDLGLGGESDAEKKAAKRKATSPAALYRDGVQLSRSNLPAVFPVPGGVIEVAVTMYGLRRMHFVPEGGTSAHVLRPHPASWEGKRAAFAKRAPRTSRVVGALAIVVLLGGLAVGIPQGLELLSQLDFIAERFGTFTSPIQLPDWANTTILVAGVLAALERALTLRNHWLIDFDTTWTGEL